MSIEQQLQKHIQQALLASYNHTIPLNKLLLRPTPDHFIGSHTLTTFPLAKELQHPSQHIATTLGEWLIAHTSQVTNYQVVQGFLNLTLSDHLWLEHLTIADSSAYLPSTKDKKNILVEFSSPNTNKPLHLGHLRNNFLGHTLSELMKTLGHSVYKLNIVNDRGVHICKSMLAYKKWGKGTTPQTSHMKGDHFVGKYYVLFEQAYKKQVHELTKQLGNREQAKKQAPLLQEVQTMLKQWEQGDTEVRSLWHTMNNWVYQGFDKTYHRLGITFDKIYYESATYLSGKKIIQEGLKQQIFYQKKDKSIWADLQAEALEQKLLLRADGTSVYMTQDIGLIEERYHTYAFDKHIYVVGNEQNHHFKVLFTILKQLKKPYADKLEHLSYGMVELPTGKMKSREGTTVDADNLIDQMVQLAKQQTERLGKTEGFTQNELHKLHHTIALGALKYFLLKVNPQKNILFDPNTSIDLQGNTGPFIQYTYARIATLLTHAPHPQTHYTLSTCLNTKTTLSPTEKNIVIQLVAFKKHLLQAAQTQNPSLLCTYAYNLAKIYNRLYATHTILQDKEKAHRPKRLYLSKATALVLKKTMHLLGINMPERM